jgi:hypothetical protein
MPQLSSLWHSLFGPNPRILPGDRHAARLIAQLMLIQAALIVAFILLTNLLWKSMSGQSIWRDRDNWVVLAGLLLILIAFALVRGGIYRPGLWLYLLATAAVPLIAPFVPDPNAEIGLLATAIIPVLLAAIVLPEREVLAILSGLIVLASVQRWWSCWASPGRCFWCFAGISGRWNANGSCRSARARRRWRKERAG